MRMDAPMDCRLFGLRCPDSVLFDAINSEQVHLNRERPRVRRVCDRTYMSGLELEIRNDPSTAAIIKHIKCIQGQ